MNPKHAVLLTILFSLIIFQSITAVLSCLTEADKDCNGAVNLTELNAHINAWYLCSACVPDLFQAIEAYYGIKHCVPDCTGKECGPDGCGGSCGICEPWYVCQNGACIPEQEPFECLHENNCFYVSVNGFGSHNGTEGNEMSLEEAEKYPIDHPDQKILFLLEDGYYNLYMIAFHYGYEVPERSGWATFGPKPGHNPIFYSINIDNYGNNPGDVNMKYRFKDMVVNPRPDDRPIRVGRSASGFEFINLTIKRNEYMSPNTASKAIHLWNSNNVLIKDCRISGPQTDNLIAFGNGISISGTNVIVDNCEISEVSNGISTGGVDVVISNNDIHKIYSDGITFSGKDLLIVNNSIHDLALYIPLQVENPNESVWNENGTIMTNPDAKWNTPGQTQITSGMEIWIRSGVNVLLGDHEIGVKEVVNDNTIILGDSIMENPDGPAPSNVDYYLRSQAHADLIQGMGVRLHSYTKNVVIKNNRLYDSLNAWAFMHVNPAILYYAGTNVTHNGKEYQCIANHWSDTDRVPGTGENWETFWEEKELPGTQPVYVLYGGYNFTIEGNLCWNHYESCNQEIGHPLNVGHIDGAVVRNNTIIGILSVYADNDVSVSNNIISYGSFGVDIEGTIEQDYNIINRGSNKYAGGHSIILFPGYSWDEWDHPDFTGIFADYYADNFQPIMSSIACDGTVNPIGQAVGALACQGCTDDSPVAVFKYDQADDYDPEIDFDATDSLACDTSITDYDWDFGDGSAGFGVKIQHTYEAGSYNARLTVTNNLGNKDSFSKTTTILPSADPDLNVYINFDNNVVDLSGKGNNGIWNGQPSYGPGIDGQAMVSNGRVDGGCITFANHESLDVHKEFTMSIWAKKNIADSSAYLIYKHLACWLTMDEERISYHLYNGSGSTGHIRTNTELVHNADWHHYALTYNGSVSILYIDGNEIRRRDYSGDIPSTGWNLVIGKNPWGNSINGSIDEFMIYNRPFNESEIRQIYCSQGGVC